MDYLVYIFYPVLFLLIFFKAKLFGKNQWNDDFLSLKQTKAIQGFLAICIIFHHLSQKTAASWISPQYIVHGLDPFVNVGFLFVSAFFFFSGYGLFISYKTKENYLTEFLKKHLGTLFLALITTNLFYLAGRSWLQNDFSIKLYFSIGEPFQLNPYAWYVLTLMFFYLIFYISFKFAKTETAAIIFTSLGVLIYILFCDFLIYGTWWYNSVPAFIIGLIFAQHKDKIIEHLKKSYILYILIFLIISIGAFSITLINSDNINRLVILISQMICSISFVLTLLLLGMKIQIGNKALFFLGSFTLELYLLHGLFVQMFSYCFISENSVSPYYIKSLPLYVLTVLVISIPLAFLVHILNGKIIQFFKRNQKFSAILIRDTKRFFLIALIAVVIITIFAATTSHTQTKKTKELVNNYINEKIKYVNIDENHKIASYTIGDGEKTIVIPVSLMTSVIFNVAAENLAKYNFTVVLLDLPGIGLSETTDSPRSIENITDEIHTALKNLNITKPSVFFSIYDTGPIIQMYAHKFSNEVSAVVAMDTLVSQEFFDSLKLQRLNKKQWFRMEKRYSQLQYSIYRLAALLGFSDWIWQSYSSAFEQGWSHDEKTIMSEIFKKSYYSKNYAQMNYYQYEYMEQTQYLTYPASIPVFFFLGFDTIKYNYFSGDWQAYHENLVTSTDMCHTTIINGDFYSLFWNAKNIAEIIGEAITGV